MHCWILLGRPKAISVNEMVQQDRSGIPALNHEKCRPTTASSGGGSSWKYYGLPHSFEKDAAEILCQDLIINSVIFVTYKS